MSRCQKSATKKLQGLKFYPRDEQANQNLVLFAESIIGEINHLERESLEQTIDTFEASMSSGDQGLFKRAQQDLLMKLSSLGYPFKQPPKGLNE